MTENEKNFKSWFCKPLGKLIQNEHAGIAILMITLPLLERYLRQKSGSHEANTVNDQFHDELLNIFPFSAGSDANARRKDSRLFWQSYRHGLLHQAFFKTKPFDNVTYAVEITKATGNAISLDKPNTKIVVNPKILAEKTLEVIWNDFTTFEASGAPHHEPAKVEAIINDPVSGAALKKPDLITGSR